MPLSGTAAGRYHQEAKAHGYQLNVVGIGDVHYEEVKGAQVPYTAIQFNGNHVDPTIDNISKHVLISIPVR